VPPQIALGVNLTFAKYVYGKRKALDIVRDKFGLRRVEAVPDNDYGPIFYHIAPEAFRSHHWEIADYAKRTGMHIDSVLTFYRAAGAISHPDPAIRESAYRVGLAMLEMASCYGARYASASLFTMNRELAEEPDQFEALFDASIRIWKRWLADAKRLRIEQMLIETTAAYREGCSTLHDTRMTLDLLDKYHEENPGTTIPVGLCYDTGHGISEEESKDPRDRDFKAWFDCFHDRILEIHLKNTDPKFQETWHFGEQHGIINLPELIAAIRDRLTVPLVLVFIEVPGKRGREIGEQRSIEGHQRSISLAREALQEAGYRDNPEEGIWEAR
jgi:sugar phosphate isomerase/epimerase